MNDIQFKNLDLNLLRVLEALLETRSVTRSAERLSLSPSAVSHALGRLRYALSDDLFERRGGGLSPTPRAEEIGAQLIPAMAQMREALTPGQFDPAVTDRTFRAMSGAYSNIVWLPFLSRAFLEAAPHAHLRILRLTDKFPELLNEGEVDVVLGVPQIASSRCAWRPLEEDQYVWVMRNGSEALRSPVTIDQLERANIIRIDYPQRYELIDALSPDPALKSLQDRARVGVSDLYAALSLVASSDMVVRAPRRLAEAWADDGRFAYVEPATPSRLVPIGALYAADRSSDVGLNWFIDLVTASARL